MGMKFLQDFYLGKELMFEPTLLMIILTLVGLFMALQGSYYIQWPDSSMIMKKEFEIECQMLYIQASSMILSGDNKNIIPDIFELSDILQS